MPRVTQLGARTSPSSAPAAVAHDPPHAHQPPDMHAQQQQPFMQPQPGIPYVPPPGMHPAHMGGGFPFMPADMPYPHAQLYPQGLMFAPAQAEMVAPQVNALPVVDVQDAEQVADDTGTFVAFRRTRHSNCSCFESLFISESSSFTSILCVRYCARLSMSS